MENGLFGSDRSPTAKIDCMEPEPERYKKAMTPELQDYEQDGEEQDATSQRRHGLP